MCTRQGLERGDGLLEILVLGDDESAGSHRTTVCCGPTTEQIGRANGILVVLGELEEQPVAGREVRRGYGAAALSSAKLFRCGSEVLPPAGSAALPEQVTTVPPGSWSSPSEPRTSSTWTSTRKTTHWEDGAQLDRENKTILRNLDCAAPKFDAEET